MTADRIDGLLAGCGYKSCLLSGKPNLLYPIWNAQGFGVNTCNALSRDMNR